LIHHCLFSKSPDEQVGKDHAPLAPQVLLVSPCSGHGVTFSTVNDEIRADLVEQDRTSHDSSLFRLARFPGSARSS
jgi:sarcosine oxidase